MRARTVLGALLAAAWLPVAAAGEMPLAQRLEIPAFVRAAAAGELETVRAKLDAGLPVDAMLPPKDPRYPYTERTALEAAAIDARLEVMRLLLARGAVLRRDARNGLYAASIHSGDHPEMLALLVVHAGPAADRDADFGPALVRAAANGADGEVRFLLSLGVDPDWRSPREPWDSPAIVRAAAHFDIVDLLLAAGADPSGGELSEAWSPLFPAALAGDADRVRRYLEMGIDPHVRGPRGNALSLAACRSPRTARPGPEAMEATRAVVAVLLEAGVDPNVASDGRTPRRCAEDSTDAELAGALARAGGRSHESLWERVKRATASAGLAIALLLGGGM